MKLTRLIFLFSLILSLNSWAQTRTRCPELTPERSVLQTTDTYRIEEWTLSPEQIAIAQRRGLAPTTDSLVPGFQERLREVLNPDFRVLHERKIELLRTRNMHIQREPELLSGHVGRQLQPSCLELYLYDLELRIQPGMRFPPNEAMASILASPTAPTRWKLIVTFSHMSWVPTSATAQARVQTLVNERWNYLAHLHTHPFFPENPTGDVGGTLVASGERDSGDIGIYLKEMQTLGLKSAYITNSFDTVLYTADDIRHRLILWRH